MSGPENTQAVEIQINRKEYSASGAGSRRQVLANIELHLAPGEFVALLGPSGCGKTTLLNIVAGLDREFDGALRLPALNGRSEPMVSYVFQNPRLLPWLTARRNIELVLQNPKADFAQVEELLAATGLSDAADRYPSRLSVGMSRRVSLARAFVIRPDLLLMDEPFTSLDEPTAHRLRLLLLSVWQTHRTTVLFVTHDLREAITLADRIVFLAGTPTSIVREMTVALAREARHDEREVEKIRETILQGS